MCTIAFFLAFDRHWHALGLVLRLRWQIIMYGYYYNLYYYFHSWNINNTRLSLLWRSRKVTIPVLLFLNFSLFHYVIKRKKILWVLMWHLTSLYTTCSDCHEQVSSGEVSHSDECVVACCRKISRKTANHIDIIDVSKTVHCPVVGTMSEAIPVTYWTNSSRISLLEHYARQVLIYWLYRTA